MKPARIPVLLARDVDVGTIVRAPLVGVWSTPPKNGAIVEPGSFVGTLTQLGRRFVLVIPEGVSGRVAMTGPLQDAVPLEYGQALFRVTPFAGRDVDLVPESAEASRRLRDALDLFENPLGSGARRRPRRDGAGRRADRGDEDLQPDRLRR